MSTDLRLALEDVAKRFRELRLWVALAVGWSACALVGLGLVLWMTRWTPPLPPPMLVAALGTLALATLVIAAALAYRSARDRRWVARRIESRYPDLNAGLLAAVEVVETTPRDRPFGFLQAAVVRGAVQHSLAHDWRRTVSAGSLLAARLANLAALGLLIASAFLLVDRVRKQPSWSFSFGPGAEAFGLTVEPGDAEIERGASLLVVARFGRLVPADADLVVDAADSSRRAMTRSLQDPTFAGRVPTVESDLTYRVEFAGQSSPTYHVKVFEHPEVLRADADLTFPAYTALEPKTVEDIRHVTAVEGTELTLTLRLNKPVATAQLLDEDDRAIELNPVAGDSNLYRARLTLDDPHKLRARLVDSDGRANKFPTEIALNVTRNRPPVVKVTRPAHDVRVSPVEELALAAKLEDDFGVNRQGITYTLAGQEPKDLILEGSGKSVESQHMLALESLGVEPDQLLSYHFWAEDVGPDGQPRRAFGDMFFAEVRPFEEIFRQGEQPPGGSAQNQQQGGGAGEQAMQLAELQKQIINATWSLMRRETSAKPSDKLAEDANVVRDSQHSAIEQAAQLAERLQDATSKSHMDQATKFMTQAESRLAESANGPAIAPLAPALAAEQAAYQALLKLRDREFQVVRGNQQQRGGGGGAGSPSQRQLNQLELTNDENRYEQQRSAQEEQAAQASQQDRETRQILNRLRELARRQADLNERLKELQAALEAAEDEQTREEIQRQLKRLRDQEQQILRDADDLRERMETEQNRERLADARQQVEQSREHVRQASEALEEGRLSQALTEGTRAGRQFEDLREQVREQSAERFSEEMTAMRNQARQLAENQQKLTEQLSNESQEAQHSLRSDDGQRTAQEQLQQQRQGLDDLLDRMRSTVQDAETTEPRLAEQLFDTVRQAEERRLPDALEAARQLAGLGIPDEAARASRQAAEGLDQLREGVERAAESVLGDETEALRLARGELEDLSEQIDREMERADEHNPNAPGQDRQGQGQRAERGQSKDANREGQPGESEPGDGQERQPGAGEPRDQHGQPGQRGEGQQPGEQGQQPGEGQGQQPGELGQQGQPGQQGQGGQQGQQGQGGRQGQGDQPGQGGQGQPQDQGQPQEGGRAGGGGNPAGLDRLLDALNSAGPGGGPGRPITGDGFREWTDRMRDVEELLDDPELRAQAARIRDRVRVAREDFRRHSKEPDPAQLQTLIADPIRELRDRVAEEVRRRESPDSLVPIDRDPVPPKFAEDVRRYYERLGSGQ